MIRNSGGLVQDYGHSMPNDSFFRTTLRFQPKSVLPQSNRAQSVMAPDLTDYQNWPTNYQRSLIRTNSKKVSEVTKRLMASPTRHNHKRSSVSYSVLTL